MKFDRYLYWCSCYLTREQIMGSLWMLKQNFARITNRYNSDKNKPYSLYHPFSSETTTVIIYLASLYLTRSFKRISYYIWSFQIQHVWKMFFFFQDDKLVDFVHNDHLLRMHACATCTLAMHDGTPSSHVCSFMNY